MWEPRSRGSDIKIRRLRAILAPKRKSEPPDAGSPLVESELASGSDMISLENVYSHGGSRQTSLVGLFFDASLSSGRGGSSKIVKIWPHLDLADDKICKTFPNTRKEPSGRMSYALNRLDSL